MLSQSADFPFIGSAAFERATARPLTVIQHRGDGRVLVRRDDEQGPNASNAGSARGFCTIDLADIFATATQATHAKAAKAKTRSQRRKSA